MLMPSIYNHCPTKQAYHSANQKTFGAQKHQALKIQFFYQNHAPNNLTPTELILNIALVHAQEALKS